MRSLNVFHFELPFLSLCLKNQQLDLQQDLLTSIVKSDRISLTNLSTFTDSGVVYHNLNFQIDQAQTFQINDHRKLNKHLKFFYFSKLIGSGLPF